MKLTGKLSSHLRFFIQTARQGLHTNHASFHAAVLSSLLRKTYCVAWSLLFIAPFNYSAVTERLFPTNFFISIRNKFVQNVPSLITKLN